MSLDWPKISIVTPSLNQGEFLEATIHSVLSQNYPNLEYIIIDGGSTDNSEEIIRKYEDRIAYWCSEKDAGHYDAVNKGLGRATGEIMAYINSDDMYLPGALRTVGNIMGRFCEIEWLTTLHPAQWDYRGALLPPAHVAGYSRQAFLEGYYAPRPHSMLGYCHDYGWIQQESTFWRRSLWEKAGGRLRTEFHVAADFDLWARFCLHAELHAAPYVLGGWRRRLGQRANQANHYATESARALEEHRAVSPLVPNRLRQGVLRRGLHRIPFVRHVLRKTIGYRARKVVRAEPAEPDGRWEIQEYRFL